MENNPLVSNGQSQERKASYMTFSLVGVIVILLLAVGYLMFIKDQGAATGPSKEAVMTFYDLNQDGLFNNRDVEVVAIYIDDKRYEAAADLNSDGQVDIKDLKEIREALLKI